MIAHDLPLLIALFAPAVVLTLLGINAAVVFLSLCLGEVLVKYVAADALSGMTTLSPHMSDLSKTMVQLGFLFAPAIATSLIMIGSVKGKMRRLVNIVPGFGVGLLIVLIGVPLFTPGLRAAIQAGSFWRELSRAQALVVGLTALISLLFLWSQRRSIKATEGRGSRHRG
ncbi:MAG TPA: hypothetical protein VJR27_05700 [Candidatus Saccharimonadales bacterium]|nr:hypothetical protein [Candidatus Saccharimonadales bacterium]